MTQKHIFCEGVCQQAWHVPKCCNVSEVELDEIIKNSDIPWFCEPCKAQRRQRRSQSNPASTKAKTPNTSLAQTEKNTLQTILSELKTLREQQAIQNTTLTDRIRPS